MIPQLRAGIRRQHSRRDDGLPRPIGGESIRRIVTITPLSTATAPANAASRPPPRPWSYLHGRSYTDSESYICPSSPVSQTQMYASALSHPQFPSLSSACGTRCNCCPSIPSGGAYAPQLFLCAAHSRTVARGNPGKSHLRVSATARNSPSRAHRDSLSR